MVRRRHHSSGAGAGTAPEAITFWLKSVGLEKYEDAFVAEDIDFAALPFLTEGMLEKIGLPLGPRAKALAAISDLRSTAPPSVRPKTKNGDLNKSQAQNVSERRQITALFCDLVDSTPLSAVLDPEDFQAIMEAYQRSCKAVISRNGGHISQYRGDGIEAYFGWPVAHEDTAERAVRTGIELIEGVKSLRFDRPLSARVGINTGLVVVGESAAGDPSVPSGAIGKTLHVAARLQSLAEPNAVVISEATRRLVRARLDKQDLGLQKLKGIPEEVLAFQVKGIREVFRRFLPTARKGLTPLFGRTEELKFLKDRWRESLNGSGQAVFVSGLPGIGKSRLVHEFARSVRGEPSSKLTFQFLPHCTQSAFFPVIKQIERMAGLSPLESSEAKLEKIKTLLSGMSDLPHDAVSLIARMVETTEGGLTQEAVTGQRLKTRTLAALTEIVVSLSKRGPVLCLFEDVQWIDPSTRELLDMLVGRVGQLQALLLITHRPEYRSGGATISNVHTLSLSRLSKADAAEMMRFSLSGVEVAAASFDRIVDESDAIPLFVEELASGLMASADPQGGRHSLSANSTWTVPETLRDALMARLDAAPTSRSVAQLAAAIGREFSWELLLPISSMPQTDLRRALRHLEGSGIIRSVGVRSTAQYMFKHALLRDAAYETLTRGRRKAVHLKIGETFERDRPDLVAGQPELLAYHFSIAGNADQAVRYWVAGGQRARSRSANLEAVAQFQEALLNLGQVVDETTRVETELEIHLSMGLCLIAVRGYASEDTRSAFARAEVLSGILGRAENGFQALFGLWGHNWMRARHDNAKNLASQLVAMSEPSNDTKRLVVAHRCMGSTLFTFGDFHQARKHLESAIKFGDRLKDAGSGQAYAVDPIIAAQLMLAWDLWFLGYPSQAASQVGAALKKAISEGDPYSMAFAQYVTSVVHYLRGDNKRSLKHAEISLRMSLEYRINLYALYSKFGHGCALAELGRIDEGLQEIKEGIDEAQVSDLGYMRAFMLGCLANVHHRLGDRQTARKTLAEAFEYVDDISGRAWEAELYRLQGDFLNTEQHDFPNEVESSYRRSIAVARSQGARSLELRGATSLARALADRNRREEATDVLQSVYTSFNEGHQTADLTRARQLLAELH